MSNFDFARNFNGVAEVFLRTPQVYAPLLQFFENVMVGESELTKEEREIIATHVSRINGCHFCVGAHEATLAAFGGNGAAPAPEDQEANPRLQDLLAYADKLTRSPAEIERADIDALKASGISEQAIEDATNVVSALNYLNRLVDAFGFEGSPEYFKMVGAALAKNGYAGLLPKAA